MLSDPRHISEPSQLVALEWLNSPVWIFDIAGRRMWWANRAAVVLWGADDLQGLQARDFADMSDVTAARLEDYRYRMAGGEVIDEDWTFYPQGEARTVRCLCSAVRIGDGRSAMLVEGRMVAPRERDPQALRAGEALRYTSVVVSMFDAAGSPIYQNPAALTVFGDDMREADLAARFHDRAEGRRVWARLKAGERVRGEFRFRTGAGPRWFSLDGRCLEDPDNGAWAVLVNQLDISVRRQAEQRLAVSEERYRELFQRNKAVELIIDPVDGSIVDANDAASGYYGYTLDQLRSMHITDINVLSPSEVTAEMDRARAEHRSHFFFRHRLASGEVRNVEVHSGPLVIEGRQLLYSIVHDITERVHAEQALRESEARYRRIIDSTREGYWMIDAEGITVDVNQALCKMLGYESSEILGRSPLDFADEENRGIFRRQMARVATTVHRRYEIALRRRDGGLVYTLFSTTSLFADDGRLVGSFAFISDVTALRHAQKELRENESRFRSFFDYAVIGMAMVDMNGRFTRVNRAYCDMLGYDEQAMLDADVIGLTHPDDQALEHTHIELLRAGKVPYFRLEKRYIHRQGHVVWGLVNAALIRDASGEPLQFIAQIEDITARKEAEHTLKKLSSAVEHSGSSVIITDASGIIEYVNPRFSEISGYSAEQVVGRSPSLLRFAATPPEVYQRMWSTISHGREWRGELKNRRRDGGVYWSLLSITPVHDENGAISHYVGVSEDVTELKEAQARAEHLAFYDALTGLANRRLLLDRLGQAVKGTQRSGGCAALLFVDLDHFKDVNDTLGHDYGDELLLAVARRIESCVRGEDTVARFGGDEFTILLPECEGAQGAGAVAEKVLEALVSPLGLGGHEVVTGASIGITLTPDDGSDVETLLKNADLAMYQAKARGRNNYQFFTPALNEAVSRRLGTEQELRRALEREELRLYFQPQVDLQDGRVRGVEALLRWHHPQRGLVMPDEFIPVAEDSGLIVPIGHWVLSEACRCAAALSAAGWGTVRMAINLSARQFRDAQLGQRIAAALDAASLSPRVLELELTETTVMDNSEQAVQTLKGLKALGLRLAIDDFGTGYSSLNYLKRFPIDALKVDRSFVKDIPDDTSDMAIAATIIAMASRLGLEVVAEGVESEAQEAFLRNQGCHLAQGYRYARPMDFQHLVAFLG